MACGPSGAERPEFLFAGNAGDSLRPLQRVVSGGELSRVFLAVRNALRRRSGTGMVLVFDEVDAGIGGRAAERVGRALAELARHHQVLCITHLPQIAAFGDVHFRVQKHLQDGRASAQIERVDGELRIDEIARMAGGRAVTPATRRHAAELLGAKHPPARCSRPLRAHYSRCASSSGSRSRAQTPICGGRRCRFAGGRV